MAPPLPADLRAGTGALRGASGTWPAYAEGTYYLARQTAAAAASAASREGPLRAGGRGLLRPKGGCVPSMLRRLVHHIRHLRTN